MAVAVSLSISLEGEASRRDSRDSSGNRAGVSSVPISMSVAVAVERLSRPLGNVDSSKRVSPVVAGGSIAVGLVGSNSGGGAVAANSDGGRGGWGGIGSSKSGCASGKNSAISGTITSVAVSTESSITVRAIVGISLSLPLSNVASTNGVSNVVARGSVAVGQVGSNSLHTISSKASIASVSSMASVAKTVTSIAGVAQVVAVSVTVGVVVGVGLSGGQGQAASLSNKRVSLMSWGINTMVLSKKMLGVMKRMRLCVWSFSHHKSKSEHRPWQAFKKRISLIGKSYVLYNFAVCLTFRFLSNHLYRYSIPHFLVFYFKKH